MNVWIIIGIGIVAIVGVCYAIYKRKINHAREQQRLTLTQNISHELKTPVASIGDHPYASGYGRGATQAVY